MKSRLLLLIEVSLLKQSIFSSQQPHAITTIIVPICHLRKLQLELNHLAKVMQTRSRNKSWPRLPIDPAALYELGSYAEDTQPSLYSTQMQSKNRKTCAVAQLHP